MECKLVTIDHGTIGGKPLQSDVCVGVVGVEFQQIMHCSHGIYGCCVCGPLARRAWDRRVASESVMESAAIAAEISDTL